MAGLPHVPTLPATAHLHGDEHASDRHGAVRDRVTTLFVAHRREILRYLAGRGCDPGEAEELTQDVFLRLYRTERAGQELDAPRHWLFRVARNLAIDHLRRTRERRRMLAPAGPDVSERVAAATPTPESQLVDDSRRQALAGAVADLTDLQRECLDLRSEGLSLKEIAGIVNGSVPGVSDAIRRAIRRLQRELDGRA